MSHFKLKVPGQTRIKAPGLDNKGDIRTVSHENGTNPAIQGAFSTMCGVCLNRTPNYTCPRCTVQYCGLECFKVHGDQCSENFYQSQVMQGLAQQRVSMKVRNDMAKILLRNKTQQEACDEYLEESAVGLENPSIKKMNEERRHKEVILDEEMCGESIQAPMYLADAESGYSASKIERLMREHEIDTNKVTNDKMDEDEIDYSSEDDNGSEDDNENEIDVNSQGDYDSDSKDDQWNLSTEEERRLITKFIEQLKSLNVQSTCPEGQNETKGDSKDLEISENIDGLDSTRDLELVNKYNSEPINGENTLLKRDISKVQGEPHNMELCEGDLEQHNEDTTGAEDEDLKALFEIAASLKQGESLDFSKIPKPVLTRFRRALSAMPSLRTVELWKPWWLSHDVKVKNHEEKLSDVRKRFILAGSNLESFSSSSDSTRKAWPLPDLPEWLNQMYQEKELVGVIVDSHNEHDSTSESDSTDTISFGESLADTLPYMELPENFRVTHHMLLQLTDIVYSYCFTMRIFNGDIGVPIISHDNDVEAKNYDVCMSALKHLLAISSALEAGYSNQRTASSMPRTEANEVSQTSESIARYLHQILKENSLRAIQHTAQEEGIRSQIGLLRERSVDFITDAASILYFPSKISIVLWHLTNLLNFIVTTSKELNRQQLNGTSTAVAASAAHTNNQLKPKKVWSKFKPYSSSVEEIVHHSQFQPSVANSRESLGYNNNLSSFVVCCKRLIKKLELLSSIVQGSFKGKVSLPVLHYEDTSLQEYCTSLSREYLARSVNLPLLLRVAVLEDKLNMVNSAKSHESLRDKNRLVFALLAESLVVEWKSRLVELFDTDSDLLSKDG